MGKVVSIAQAKDSFSQLVHDAEDGRAVQITRRGRPVAVIVSAAEYTRLTGGGGEFWDHLDAFRQEHGLNSHGVEPEEWVGHRDSDNGRDFSW